MNYFQWIAFNGLLSEMLPTAAIVGDKDAFFSIRTICNIDTIY